MAGLFNEFGKDKYMSMIRSAIIGAIILGTLSLVACQSGRAVKPQPLTTAEVKELTYPSPELAFTETYPSPDEIQGDSTSAYPGPGSLRIFPEGQLPIPPEAVPQPQSGKAAISGLLFSYTSRIIIPDTNYYLTPAIGEKKELAPLLTGPKPDAGDILLRSSSNGEVWADNIPPGDYFLVVWAPYSWAPALNHDDKSDSPRLLSLEADKSYALGLLEIAWP
jgi:hypothetical protein